MRSLRDGRVARSSVWIWVLATCVGIFVPNLCAQQLARRLILKDGSYQLATKWEVKGDRVRYLSAERDEWEELPNSMVDWTATDKWEKDRAAGVPSPEAVELDRELEAERRTEEAKTPQVAPGLRLPEDAGMLLLDTFQSQPQLVPLEQQGGALNRNRKGNILRAVIIPIASSKQSIEIDGLHAKVQAHATLPSIYVNLQPDQDASANAPQRDKPVQPVQPVQPEQPWDRFHIVRLRAKNGKRIVGDIKINPLGKVSQEQNLVLTTSRQLTGGWVKVTPAKALEPGEYAVVEFLGQDRVNMYVWDFGVNPSAPANAGALGPDASALPRADKPNELKSDRK